MHHPAQLRRGSPAVKPVKHALLKQLMLHEIKNTHTHYECHKIRVRRALFSHLINKVSNSMKRLMSINLLLLIDLCEI
jgi:hypothetical protein